MRREQWVNNALETVIDCDTVFLDPDNGLQTPSVLKYHKNGPKYVYYDEVKKFLSKTNTLIVYHHLGRNGSHASQIQQGASILQSIAGNSYKLLSLIFKPYSPRAYFIITKQNEVLDRVNDFMNSNWKQCFEKVE